MSQLGTQKVRTLCCCLEPMPGGDQVKSMKKPSLLERSEGLVFGTWEEEPGRAS